MRLSELIRELTSAQRILAIALFAVLATLLVKGLRRTGVWVLTPRGTHSESLLRRYPKFVTLTTLAVSALTFGIYFAAVGLILREIGVSLTAYLASASVIGLAVGFGSQGLVQDVVSSLTLVFSDTLDVGDMVDISGQSGRIDAIGLRFTTLVNLFDQRIFIPNRSITQINRYHNGGIRAFVDVQLPEGAEATEAVAAVEAIARGMRAQYRAIILAEPRTVGVVTAETGGWRYVRIEFLLWPGQGALIESTFVKRVVAAMRQIEAGYAEWQVTVIYRALP